MAKILFLYMWKLYFDNVFELVLKILYTLTTNCCWKIFLCFGKKRQNLVIYYLKTWRIKEYYQKYLMLCFEGKHETQHTGSFHWYISWAPPSFPPLITANVLIKNHAQTNSLSKKLNTTKALASLVSIIEIPEKFLFS